MQHLSWRHLSISAIFQLLLTWLWPNFKDRFLGPFLTYSNCHYDIFSGNICPCDICPYQEYLSCHWPDFDQTLKVGPWDHLKHIPTVTVKFMKNFIKKIHQKNFAKIIFGPQTFLGHKWISLKSLVKLGQSQLRYSWYGQMSPGQMFSGQMSPWHLESV